MGIGRRIMPEDVDNVNNSIKYINTESNTEHVKEEKSKSINAKSVDDSEFIPEEPIYNFDDVILPTSIKDKILEVADYAANSRLVFETWGLNKRYKQSNRIGINLYGPPGTGKTMAAHAIANYLGRKIIAVNYADIESKYVGETPKNIRRAFEAAKKSNSILFFDEADAILSKRVTNMSNATDVSVNQTRSVMLMIMNNYQDFILFATNFIENFDPAFMRRISTHIEFKLPDYEGRKKILQHYILSSMPNDIDVDKISKEYDGVSGSDISNAILMAAFKAARLKSPLVTNDYVEEKLKEIVESKKANKGVKKTPVTEAQVAKDVKKYGKEILANPNDADSLLSKY
ncbi:MAG: ATP-binding protein [Selenomonas ruminantium]|uniref:ATP-binding protein n=1 Tax=Selenomonas ruminantium TaxID=971 RepID=A0A927WMG4_SELRU|nr:ATP-binding protein [Selenomonas ruminantium]